MVLVSSRRQRLVWQKSSPEGMASLTMDEWSKLHANFWRVMKQNTPMIDMLNNNRYCDFSFTPKTADTRSFFQDRALLKTCILIKTSIVSSSNFKFKSGCIRNSNYPLIWRSNFFVGGYKRSASCWFYSSSIDPAESRFKYLGPTTMIFPWCSHAIKILFYQKFVTIQSS